MYGKPAITCFKYQVFLYGSEAITYLNAILWVVTVLQSQQYESSHCPHPHYRQPSPALYGSITFTHLKENFVWLNYHTYFEKQRGNLHCSRTITSKTIIPNPRV